MAEKRFPGLAVGSRGCSGNGPPGFDRHFWLGGALENLAVEQFIVKLPVEAFVVAILPGRCRSDAERLHADVRQPFLDCCCDKFAAIIGLYIRRRPARDEEVGQNRQQVSVFELPRHDQNEAFADGLIDDHQDPELATYQCRG
jgi:hypothetical protein